MSIIETKMLTKVYGTDETAVKALNNISFKVEKGEFVAIMGPSGCGKSTLLHMLGGLDSITSGSVMIDGSDISKMNDNELASIRRRKIGFIFQYYNLIPVLGAADNAALPLILDGVKPATARKTAVEWLTRLGLGSRLNHRPDQMSGGQQQRVAIARALSTDPTLVLADEPTGNLDSKTGDEVVGQLKRISSEWGRSVVMVTHDSRIAAYADRIIFLKDGSIVDEARLTEHGASDSNSIREKVDSL
jgi:ABC-type antimicrobial peptide transport system, ATPase component